MPCEMLLVLIRKGHNQTKMNDLTNQVAF